jgi:hypothetical protein
MRWPRPNRVLLRHTRWAETRWDAAAGHYLATDFSFAVVLGNALVLTRGTYDEELASLARNEHLHVAICQRAAAQKERAAVDILEHGRDELLRILQHLGVGGGTASAAGGGR